MNVVHLPHLSLLIIAWFVMDRATPLMMKAAHRLGLYDVPHGYKAHDHPVPYVGGVCIYFAFCAAVFATLRFESFTSPAVRPLVGIAVGGFFVMIFGLLDDLKPIHAVVKLLMIAAVTFLITRFGVMIRLTPWEAVNVGLTILWMAGVTSAMNSLDNMDGAAGGTAAIAAFFTFLVAFWREPLQSGPTYFSLALMGCALGFLGHNLPPARLFLGNNGAFLLGFLLASLAVMTGWSTPRAGSAAPDPVKALVVPCSILVVPLYDITLATVLRIVNGRVKGLVEAIVYCGRDHLSHRLRRMFGFTVGQTLLVMYGLAFVGGGIGYIVSLPFLGPSEYLPLAGLSLLVLVAVGTVLAKSRVYEPDTGVIEGPPPPAPPIQ